MMPSAFAARRASTRTTSRASSSPMRSRSAARRPTRTCRRRRWPKTVPLRRRPLGRRLQDRRPLRRHAAASSGAWTPGRRSCRCPIAAPRCGAISSSRPPTIRRASSRPTRRPARSSGRPTSATGSRTCSSPRRRSRSRTRSSSAPPAATAACATSSPALDAARPASCCGSKYTIPAPGEPGSETWKDKNNAWQTGGGAMWVTGSYDVATNQVIWGTGNPVPMFDATYRPGDNLYTNSVISWNPDDGKMNWYFQYTPGDHWDYDEAGTHILIDGQVNGRDAQAHHPFGPQRLPLHDGAQQRADLMVKPYLDNINWTKGIDQKTGKPVDYDPKQGHPALCRHRHAGAGRADQEDVPVAVRRQQLLAVGLQPEDQADLHPGAHRLRRHHAAIPSLSNKARRLEGRLLQADERYETDFSALDPLTGEIKDKVHVPYPNYSGTLATARRPRVHRLHRRHVRRLRRHDAASSSGRSTSASASTRRR